MIMDNRKVQLNFITGDKSNNIEKFVYWPATQKPFNPKLYFQNDDRKKLLAEENGVQFESFSDASMEEFNYFVAKLDSSDQLFCKPIQIYRMMPNFTFKDTLDDQNKEEKASLSRREQFDEFKNKFGSKKSQRDLG